MEQGPRNAARQDDDRWRGHRPALVLATLIWVTLALVHTFGGLRPLSESGPLTGWYHLLNVLTGVLILAAIQLAARARDSEWEAEATVRAVGEARRPNRKDGAHD